MESCEKKDHQGQRTIGYWLKLARARVWARARAFWRSGALFGTWAGIWHPGRILVLGLSGALFGTRASILALGRTFRHFAALARAHVRAHAQALWCSGARSGTQVGILAPGSVFGHEGEHFGTRAHVWACGKAFWCSLLGRMFGHESGYFGAWARILILTH